MGAGAARPHRGERSVAGAGPGQYLYVKSGNCYSANPLGRGGAACTTYAADHRQIWAGADGSGLMRDTTGPSSYTSRHDQAVWRSMKARILKPGTSNAWFAPNCFPPSPMGEARALPTDPRRLLAKIEQMQGHRAAGTGTGYDHTVHGQDVMTGRPVK